MLSDMNGISGASQECLCYVLMMTDMLYIVSVGIMSIPLWGGRFAPFTQAVAIDAELHL